MDMYEMCGYFVLFTIYGFIFYYVSRAYSRFRHAGGVVGFRDEETGEFTHADELVEDRIWARAASIARRGGDYAER